MGEEAKLAKSKGNGLFLAHLSNKGRVDMDLVCLDVGRRSRGSVLDGDDGPGGVDGVHLEMDNNENMDG